MFARKTVDSILAPVSNMVADLEALAAALAGDAAALEAQAAIARQLCVESAHEAERALAFSEKLSRLIGA